MYDERNVSELKGFIPDWLHTYTVLHNILHEKHNAAAIPCS